MENTVGCRNNAQYAGAIWGQSKVSLKSSLAKVSDIVTGAKHKAGHVPAALLRIPVSPTSMVSLNKCLFVEYLVSKDRWNLAHRPSMRNTSGHSETQ